MSAEASLEASLQALAKLVRGSECVVALTGAGISVPSGIPDFRSPGTGIWENIDPMKVAHIEAFHRDPSSFWRFYAQRFQTLSTKLPNAAHIALAQLERVGLLKAVITQNVDQLHRRAGSSNVIEVHGSIATSSCPLCGASYPLEEVRSRHGQDPDGVPRCDQGHPLKPDVVLFGELLPVEAFARAERLAAEADLMLCIGSSLEVHPVAALPELTLTAGGALAILTQGPTPLGRHAAIRLNGDVVAELDGLLAALEVTHEPQRAL